MENLLNESGYDAVRLGQNELTFGIVSEALKRIKNEAA